MARQIYTVNATLVDANGNFSVVSGFPKRFDSNAYASAENPELTALRRAKAAFHDQLSKFYAVDGRQMQTVVLSGADGREVLRDSEGALADPEPEPEPESEEPEA